MLILLFILGLAIGSFLNVLIDRLAKKQSILGRSYCDHCKKKLKSQDLIPVFSYFQLGGKCRYCHKKLSAYYPFVEIVTAVFFVVLWIYLPTNVILGSTFDKLSVNSATPESTLGFWTSQNDVLVRVLYLGLFSSLIGIFFADLKYQIIPDELQIALFLFAFLIIGMPAFEIKRFLGHLFSGAAIMAPMYLLHVATKGKGMGFADVKLSFTIGFLLGIIGGFIAVYIGFVTGAVVGLILLASHRKKWRSKIAFGPFLVLGTVTVLIFQPQLMEIFRFIFGF